MCKLCSHSKPPEAGMVPFFINSPPLFRNMPFCDGDIATIVSLYDGEKCRRKKVLCDRASQFVKGKKKRRTRLLLSMPSRRIRPFTTVNSRRQKDLFFFFLLLVITCLHLHFSHAPTSTTFPANRVTEISFAPSLLKFQNYNNNNNLRRKLSVARAMHLLLEWCSSWSWGKWRDQCVKPRGRKSSNVRKTKKAPEPAGAWPIIGHLHLLGGGDQLLYRTLGAMADKWGPAFNIRLGSRSAFVVSSWEVVKECFTINDKALASRPKTAAAKHMGYDYAVFGFAPYTPFWREMRKIATLELLSNRRLEALKHVRISEVEMGLRELHGLWAKNNSRPVLVELKKWLEDMTLNMVVRMVAGKRYFGASATCDDSEARQCQKAINQFFHLIGIFTVSDALPFFWWLDWQGHEMAMKKTAKELDAILEGWLEEHRQRRVSGGIESESEQDFIDVMLSLQEEGHLSQFQHSADISIKSTCLALILGGSDTTSGTLTWAISLLLNNPNMLKKAQEELDQQIGMDRQVDDSDIKNLVYLQAIIKETLRLYPAGPLLGPREAMEDCTVAGYHIPAGTRLIVNVWKIQRDPRVWKNPSAFQPERFLTSHTDVDFRGQQFELIPFGSGRRSCPGASFALQVLHLTLARLLHAFELATPSDQPVDMTESPGLTIPKATPLEVVLSPRLPPNPYGF